MASKILSQPVRLALIQLACTADKAQNLAHARQKVLEASKPPHNAQIVVLPECFNSPYGTKYFGQYAETLFAATSSSPNGAAAASSSQEPSAEASPSWHALKDMAKEAGVWLIGGSIPERVRKPDDSSASSDDKADPDLLYNTSLVFGPQGQFVGAHRKVHLFDIDIPGKIRFKESEVLKPGNKVTILDLPGLGKIGLAICYDVRFPELATIAARKGAFLLLYPGAFNLTTGALHWELQARARAMDNQLYVGLCSPARDMGADYHAWGHSIIVDPNAEILSSLDEKEGIVVAELKGERIEEVRKGIPLYTQRRFDVYPDISKGEVKFEEPGVPS